MAELTNQAVLERLQPTFGQFLSDVEEPYGLLTITIPREQIIQMLEFLHADELLQMNFLTTMCGIHYPSNKDKELGMIYHVHSLVHNVRLRIKIFFPIADPVVPTATNLYATANWMEREAFDFYGV